MLYASCLALTPHKCLGESHALQPAASGAVGDLHSPICGSKNKACRWIILVAAWYSLLLSDGWRRSLKTRHVGVLLTAPHSGVPAADAIMVGGGL